jgi:hypothetical protein
MQVRTRHTNRQARSLRLDSAPALLAVVGRAAMAGVGIPQPSHRQSASQTINRLYAARGKPDITRTDVTPPVTIQSRYRSGHRTALSSLG